MSPATPWTELSGTATAWSNALPIVGSVEDDLFTVFLFDGPGLEVLGPISYTELSGVLTAHTELTAPTTSYVELTL